MAQDGDYQAEMERVMSNLALLEPEDVITPTFIDQELKNSKMAWAISYKTSFPGMR